MASVDFFAIKEKIVTILKTDATLWDATPSDRTTLRKIEAGSPSPKGINEPPIPRCWVTANPQYAVIKQYASNISNAAKGTEFDMKFDIIIAVDKKDGSKSEEQLDDFCKAVIEVLQANYDLRTPAGAESTRVADRSEVIGIREYPSFKGDNVMGRAITLRVWASA